MTKLAGWTLVLVGCFQLSTLCAIADYLPGPLSQYCLYINNKIRPICQSITDQDCPIRIQFCVDSHGNIDQVTSDHQSRQTEVLQQAETIPGRRASLTQMIIQQIESLRVLDPPPSGCQLPLWFLATISGHPPSCSVGLRDVDFGPYMADVQRYVKRHWFPPTGLEFQPITLSFKILPDGNINNLTLSRSSGDPQLDQMALRAVQSSAPLRPLPDGVPDSIDMQFSLDCNHAKQSQNF